MSESDRHHWDDRYRRLLDSADEGDLPSPQPPSLFTDHLDLFPTKGLALELACGPGSTSLWLARRGLDVIGVDVSPVAVDVAQQASSRHGLSSRCHFATVDLDDGLPETPPADLVICHLYRNPALYHPMLERLSPNGRLAVAVLSEVGSGPGRYRAEPGELRRAFGDALTVIVDREHNGHAVLIGRLSSSNSSTINDVANGTFDRHAR